MQKEKYCGVRLAREKHLLKGAIWVNVSNRLIESLLKSACAAKLLGTISALPPSAESVNGLCSITSDADALQSASLWPSGYTNG